MFPIGYRGTSCGRSHSGYVDMSDSPTFEIQFDENKTVFHPNDLVKGNVRFLGYLGIVTKQSLIQGILVGIKCCGELNHATRSTDQFFQRTYFDKQKYIYGNGKVNIEAPKRGSVFPFEFKLPPVSEFPQTFVGLYGSVICTIEVSVKSKIDTPSLSQRINLNTILDLNKLKRAQELRESIEKSVTDAGLFKLFSLVKQEALRISFMVSQGAFVPDEILSFHVEIANVSKRSISNTRVELIQEATYTTSKSAFLAKTTNKTICSVDGPILNSNNFQAWEGVIEVPQVPCSTVGETVGCIQMGYKLKFIVETEGWCSDVRAEIPIRIGSVALAPLDNDSREKYRTNYTVDIDEIQSSKSRRGSIASLLSFGSYRRPSTSSSIHRLPDYYTAVQDVHRYTDSQEIPPPTYEEAITELE